MTKVQLKKAMTAAGIAGEVGGVAGRLTVTLHGDDTMRVFCDRVANWDGHGNEAGSWRLTETSADDRGNPNDRMSAHHY